MPRPKFNIEWDAEEYEHKERNPDWFWAVTIMTVAVSITSIIFGNIIFAILVIVSAFSLSLFINKPPETIHVVLDEKGITKNKMHYPYSALHSFWIDDEHSHRKIILRSQKLFMPLIIIPLGDTDAVRVERTLLRFLPREFYSLPFVERLLEYLGF